MHSGITTTAAETRLTTVCSTPEFESRRSISQARVSAAATVAYGPEIEPRGSDHTPFQMSSSQVSEYGAGSLYAPSWRTMSSVAAKWCSSVDAAR